MYHSRTSAASSSVAFQLSQAYGERLKREQDEKTKNRQVLSTIADIIRFLARQNISFRGHREHSDSDNRGNFLEIVHFMANYNPLLKDWLANHPGNVSWLSHDVQNELLQVIADEVLSNIISECAGKMYSIMCDELSDRANYELTSPVVRYVIDSGIVWESLVALIKVNSTTASNLCDVVVARLEKLHLPLEFVIAQCYDGAANMSEQYNGLQARLKDKCPRKPIYVHCWAHVLNLVLQDAVKSVRLCTQTFDLLHYGPFLCIVSFRCYVFCLLVVLVEFSVLAK